MNPLQEVERRPALYDLTARIVQRDRDLDSNRDGEAWFQANKRPAHLHCTVGDPVMARQLNDILEGEQQFNSDDKRPEVALDLTISLVDAAGGTLVSGDTKQEKIGLARVGHPFTTHRTRIMTAHSVTLRAGKSADGTLRLAEYVLEKHYSAGGPLTLMLKFCSEVTSKRYGTPIQVVVAIGHSAAPQSSHALAPEQPVPWLTKAPRSTHVDIVSDARPGKMLLLVGEPLKADRSPKHHVSCRLHQGQASWPLVRVCRKGIPEHVFYTTLPRDLVSGSYEIVLSDLSAEFVSEIRLPLQVLAPSLHTKTQDEVCAMLDHPTSLMSRVSSLCFDETGNVALSTPQVLQAAAPHTHLCVAHTPSAKRVRDPPSAPEAPCKKAQRGSRVQQVATKAVSLGLLLAEPPQSVTAQLSSHGITVHNQTLSTSFDASTDLKLQRNASLDSISWTDLGLSREPSFTKSLGLSRESSLKSVDSAAAFVEYMESATAFVEGADSLDLPSEGLERFGSNDSIRWAAMLA